MTNRALAAALGCLALLAIPGLSNAQSAARGDMTGSPGGVAAPASPSADQIRLEIWSANAERKTEYAGQLADHKAAVAAYEAEVARVAAETARIRQDADARQQAYDAQLTAYNAELAACHAGNARGCHWVAPPPRKRS